jgi:hypothetical protein
MIEYQVNESELLAAIAELKMWDVVKTLHKALKDRQDATIELEFSYNMRDIYLLNIEPEYNEIGTRVLDGLSLYGYKIPSFKGKVKGDIITYTLKLSPNSASVLSSLIAKIRSVSDEYPGALPSIPILVRMLSKAGRATRSFSSVELESSFSGLVDKINTTITGMTVLSENSKASLSFNPLFSFRFNNGKRTTGEKQIVGLWEIDY